MYISKVGDPPSLPNTSFGSRGKVRCYNDHLSILSFISERKAAVTSGSRRIQADLRLGKLEIGAIIMAQRLATNYASAYFIMSEQDLDKFVNLFAKENILVHVKVCDNGDRDIIIEDRCGEIQLPFRRVGNRFLCESSYVISDLTLANAMRKAMKTFKGHGIVHRIYDGFTVVYHYDEGAVVRIEEVSDDTETPIFEAKPGNLAKELESVFRRTGSEQEIAWIREETDRLLDLRNWAKKATPERIGAIDEKLAVLARRLFVLEA